MPKTKTKNKKAKHECCGVHVISTESLIEELEARGYKTMPKHEYIELVNNWEENQQILTTLEEYEDRLGEIEYEIEDMRGE